MAARVINSALNGQQSAYLATKRFVGKGSAVVTEFGNAQLRKVVEAWQAAKKAGNLVASKVRDAYEARTLARAAETLRQLPGLQEFAPPHRG